MITVNVPITTLQYIGLIIVFGLGMLFVSDGFFNFTKSGKKSSMILGAGFLFCGIYLANVWWPFLVVTVT
jgi:hypothetical protein